MDEDFEAANNPMSTWCWPTSVKTMNNLRKEIEIDEHLIALEALVHRLNTDVDKVRFDNLNFLI